MNKRIKALTELKVLLGQPQYWTKKELARDCLDDSIDFDDPEAYSFCLAGGCARLFCKDEHLYTEVIALLNSTLRRMDFKGDLVLFNDWPDTEHKDILNLIDTTIHYIEKAEEINGGN